MYVFYWAAFALIVCTLSSRTDRANSLTALCLEFSRLPKDSIYLTELKDNISASGLSDSAPVALALSVDIFYSFVIPH